MRVVDGGNDMVVEYVTSFAAAALVYWLPPTGAFDLPAGVAGVEFAAVATLVAFQVGAEVFVDTFACALEGKGGLMSQYAAYWRGMRVSTVALKLGMTVGCTCSVMAFIVVAR